MHVLARVNTVMISAKLYAKGEFNLENVEKSVEAADRLKASYQVAYLNINFGFKKRCGNRIECQQKKEEKKI